MGKNLFKRRTAMKSPCYITAPDEIRLARPYEDCFVKNHNDTNSDANFEKAFGV